MTHRLQGSLVVSFLALVPCLGIGHLEAAEPPRVSIFVGPQTRDGFIDTDAGLRDSIQDVQQAFRRADPFTLTATPALATLTLTIAARRIPAGDSASVGVPIGGTILFLPIKRRAIYSILRVGTYELAITSEADHDSWRSAARQVVKDVRAWVDANRAQLTP
jgi:hypothetical protein